MNALEKLAPWRKLNPLKNDALTSIPEGLRHIYISIHADGAFGAAGALLIRPLRSRGDVESLDLWNTPLGWRAQYPSFGREHVCFAEDAFGEQFCYDTTNGNISKFDPETGHVTTLCERAEDWFPKLAEDVDYSTGWPVLIAWEVQNDELPDGYRLVPKIPFVCGGAYNSDNVRSCRDSEGMFIRAEIARQIQGLPDGSKIQFHISN